MGDSRRAFVLFAVALSIACALLAYSLRLAAAYQDDFTYLALARHLESPWPLLLQDSVGSYFFRPVVMLGWWLTDSVAEGSIAAHSAIGIAVHGLNAVLLHCLLRRHRIEAGVAGMVAIGFLVHPAAAATSFWLSARFDLFTATFGLLALIALDRHLQQPSWRALFAAALAMLASLLSKEIGFAFAVLAIGCALWSETTTHSASARQRWLAAASMAGAAAIALAMRSVALRPLPSSDGLWAVLLQLLGGGMASWLQSLPAFLVVPQGRLASVLAWATTLAVLASLMAFTAPRRQLAREPMRRLLAIGLALMLLAAAAQSPTTADAPIFHFSLGTFNPGGVVSARFYYVPLLGFAFVLAALAQTLAATSRARPARLAFVGLAALAIAGMLASSRGIARDWARFTVARSEVFARPAIEAVSALRQVEPGCKVYLLGTPPEADLLRDMIDTGVKRALPRGHPALACFVQAEHAPWYHLLERRALPPDAHRPLEVIEAGGRPYPPLPVGNLVYYFVRFAPGSDAQVAQDPGAVFLAMQGGSYVDVTADVRSGARKPRFFDRRAPPP
ncbi:MAG TPA: hypothetical protein VEC19_13600 [Usitatibacter sp.]|nr:hypothetical protein [Usitatibacter sp.]